jgi:hypothetical protein
MRVWPALLLAPLLALASIAFGYALVEPACTREAHWMVHASTLLFLAAALGTTVLAWGELRVTQERGKFLALVSTWTGAFFSLVIAAQGLTQAILSPCTH